MIQLKESHLHNSYRFAIKIPGGATAYIFVIEDDEGTPIMVDCSIGKCGLERAAWANALVRFITFGLQNTSLDEVIGLLSDIATDRFIVTDGEMCRSGPEAFAIALRSYRQMRGL